MALSGSQDIFEFINMKYEIYSGAGNDFVMIDNWNNKIPFEKQSEFTVKICNENFKDIDGVIFADKPLKEGSIRMNYYNHDGSFGAMCGNGARCIAMFAYKNNIIPKKEFIIEAVDDFYTASIIDDINVKIDFPEPKEISLNISLKFDLNGELDEMNVHYVNVGSDHIVIFIDDLKTPLDNIDINGIGRTIRFHEKFQPRGANVSFVQILSENEIRVRTYERGVERETLACGTGIIASAIVAGLTKNTKPPVKVLSQSGEWLIVNFKNEDSKIKNLSLLGSAKKIGEGEIK